MVNDDYSMGKEIANEFDGQQLLHYLIFTLLEEGLNKGMKKI